MKKIGLPFIFQIHFLLFGFMGFAQGFVDTNWTWMHGDYLLNSRGVYQFEPNAPRLMPGGRSDCASWKVNDTEFWLFGGKGVDGFYQSGNLNDLWKYSLSSNQWTWFNGSNSIDGLGEYGNKGVPASGNTPGARSGSATWTDNAGNLWLFGGVRYSANSANLFFNDLWKYNRLTNQWTWVTGDSTAGQYGIYESLGISISHNRPGARVPCASWKDAAGNFWLFGGYGFGSWDVAGPLNDLWKYNVVMNQWTWMGGKSMPFGGGVYGVPGVEDVSNIPGSRTDAVYWTDLSGNFWLYGGAGMTEQPYGGGSLSDLWKYDPLTGNWTWMHGSKMLNQTAQFGVKGIPSPLNMPGPRINCNSWTDGSGNLWLFGGTMNYFLYNDLWRYNTALNQWTWVKGDNVPNQPGAYNVGGVPGFISKPGSRTGGASWFHSAGSIFLFGGFGNNASAGQGLLNDLFALTINPLLPLPVKLRDFYGRNQDTYIRLYWQTESETNFSHFVIQQSGDGLNFRNRGSVYAQGGNKVNSYSFDDQKDNDLPRGPIYYRLQMVDVDGSIRYSKIIVLDTYVFVRGLKIYPDPVVKNFLFTLDLIVAENIKLTIIDMNGKVVQTLMMQLASGSNTNLIDVSFLPPGTYILMVQTSSGLRKLKFIKEP